MNHSLEQHGLERESIYLPGAWPNQDPATVCRSISRAFRSQVVPLYRRPFPPEPAYVDPDGRTIRVQHPTFGPGDIDHTTYLRLLGSGVIVARLAHGVTHALRVTLFAQALIAMYRLAGRTPVRDPFGVSVAAAFHDVAREEEGQDRWDRQSADMLAAYLQSVGASPGEIEVLHHAVAAKDPGDAGFLSDEQRIVHDADCLDIIRALKNPGEFRAEELCVYGIEELDPTLRTHLVAEATDIVLTTEDPTLKTYLERSAVNAYEDFITVLWKLQLSHDRWPLFAELLSDVFAFAADVDRQPHWNSPAAALTSADDVLYHASPFPLAEITPVKRSTPATHDEDKWPALVYASDVPAYAAAHSFPWGTHEGIRLNVGGPGPVEMWIPERHRHRLTQPVYLYTVPADGFQQTLAEKSGHTYHCDTPVRALSCTQFFSVESAITHYGGIIHYEE